MHLTAKEISQLFCTSSVEIRSIKTLNLKVFKPKCLYDYIQSLDLIRHHQMALIPGYQGNENTDEYAVIGSVSLRRKLPCLLWLTKLMIRHLKELQTHSLQSSLQR